VLASHTSSLLPPEAEDSLGFKTDILLLESLVLRDTPGYLEMEFSAGSEGTTWW
jgi:hypothetical protein